MFRMLWFVAGMTVGEIIFSFILIAQDDLSFQFKTTQQGWYILTIELILGIAVFVFFYGISIASGYFFRKKSNT